MTTSVVTSARTSGPTSATSHTDDHAAAAAGDVHQQLITELFMQHGCYPSCKLTSPDKLYLLRTTLFKYACSNMPNSFSYLRRQRD